MSALLQSDKSIRSKPTLGNKASLEQIIDDLEKRDNLPVTELFLINQDGRLVAGFVETKEVHEFM